MKQTKNKIRVMATGVFDLLHPGHIYYLEQSRALGDELYVVIANDEVVRRTKAEPLFEARHRQHMIESLACVDKAIVPTETEPERYYQTVLDIAPDIITLGHDQSFSQQQLAAELAAHGWQGKVVRIDKYPVEDISSTKLKSALKGKH